jgi:ribosomal protein S12 methylthiotransferase
MKYLLISLGCSKNLVDSERFAALMQSYGLKRTEYIDKADIVLVNSCAFLCSALAELDDTLCEILLETRGRKIKLIVTGCVTKRGFEEFQDLFPEVNKWVTLKDFEAFEKYLTRYVLPKGTPKKRMAAGQRVKLEGGQHVYLRIADGCENNCSYCTIPEIRGKLVSEPIEKLVAEATALQKKGRELVLIAQDSCMYGTDLYQEKALPRLIEALHEIPGFDWIRILYLHPDHFEYEWTELWNKYPKLLPYFEIPIQHVSDRIIHLMNRKKGYEELKHLFNHIKSEVPNAVFRTTLMVGYPTETKKELQMIDRFLDEVDILHAGVFGYSPEKEGPAYEPPEDYNWQRVDKLEAELAVKIGKAKEQKMQRFVGTKQQVILESYDPRMEAYVGRLWFQAPEIDGIVYVQHLAPESPILSEVEVVDALGDELWCFGPAFFDLNKKGTDS